MLRRGLIVAALLAAPQLARADERKDADAHAKRGVAAYNLGRYDQAVAEFESAYELFPTESLLFNLGQAHRKLGHCEDALHYYETYLAGDADPVLRATVEARVAELGDACRLKDLPPGPVIEPAAVAAVSAAPAAPEVELEEEIEVEPSPWRVEGAGTLGWMQIGDVAIAPIGVEVAATREHRAIGAGTLRIGAALDLSLIPWRQRDATVVSPAFAPWLIARFEVPRGLVGTIAEVGVGLDVLAGLGADGHPLERRDHAGTAVMPAARLAGGVTWPVGTLEARAELVAGVELAGREMPGVTAVQLGVVAGIGWRP